MSVKQYHRNKDGSFDEMTSRGWERITNKKEIIRITHEMYHHCDAPRGGTKTLSLDETGNERLESWE